MNDRRPNDPLKVYWFDVDACKGDEFLQAGITIKRYGDKAREYALANISSLTDPSEKQEWQRILTRIDALVAPRASTAVAGTAK
jgi:hypothetical protein